MSLPEFSVIIPVYRVPLDYLRACLDSLVAQTMRDCEFIVVSDGAPEAETFICEEYAAKDSRFKFFKREHAGVSAARNYGMEQAQGEYITFVDSDDCVANSLCNIVYSVAKKENAIVVLFEQVYLKKERNVSFKIFDHNVPKISPTEKDYLLKTTFFPDKNNGVILKGVCCKAYEKTFLKKEKIIFNQELSFSEDQFFTLQTLLRAARISYLAEPLYIQKYRSNSASYTYKPDFAKEFFFYINQIKNVVGTTPSFNQKLLYDRIVQLLLYSLDKCIFRPERMTLKKRKELFLLFINHSECVVALKDYERWKFSLVERIACYLCRKKMFYLLLMVSKKWHLQKRISDFSTSKLAR